jgi:hypothetical protein
MIMRSALSLAFKRSAFALTAAGTLILTGCGLGTQAAPSAATALNLAGHIHGGQTPIQGAYVVLYATDPAATSYGAPATVLGTAYSDVYSNFTISPISGASCPAGQQAYITAAGGSSNYTAGLINNSMLEMAALGKCENLSTSTFTTLNELTTVAAAYALSGFTTTTFDTANNVYKANVGAPVANNPGLTAISALTPGGLAHAFINASNLVDPVAGLALPTVNVSVGGVTDTGSVPVAEINTLGDIVQACVNNGGTGNASCTTLFADTISASGKTPANTLQALINLARNPYTTAAMNSTSGLLSLSSANSAFQPTLSANPNDWSLAVTYALGTTSNTNLLKPYWMGMDMNDTVYLGAAATTTTTPALFGVSSYGITVPLFGSMAAGTATRGVAPDALGNVWVDNNSSGLSRFSTTTGALSSTYVTLLSANGIGVDAANNVWVGHAVNGATSANVDEFAYTAGTPATWASHYTAMFPVGYVYGIAIDKNQNVWGGTYTPTTPPANAEVLANTGTIAAPTYVASGTVITPVTTPFPSTVTKTYGAVFDASGNAWYTNYSGATTATSGIIEAIPNSPSAITSISVGTSLVGTTNGTNGVPLGNSTADFAAIDGAGTVFISDNTAPVYSFTMYNTVSGAVLSPSTGITGCYLATATSTTCAAAVNNPRQPAVDSTGSVWAGITSGGVTQVIGIAAPSYPLLSAGQPGLSPGLTAVNPLP